MIAPAPKAPSEKLGLIYPHGGFIPIAGTLVEAAPGVFWTRFPLPFGLDHINVYVLDAGDHWAVIDCGLKDDRTIALWEALLAGPLAGKPVGRVVVTHYHPDHIGLAGWLCERFGVPLEIPQAEYLLARVLTLDIQDAPPEPAVAFYRAAGWPEPALDRFRAQRWGGFARGVSALPGGYRRLRAGDTLTIGGRDWRVVVGSGHSPEHACLWCASDGLLLAGDQVLPRITSNVSVYPTEPASDPLADWLASIETLRALPADTRVLPGHNTPFERLHVRLEQLADDHARKLDAVAAFCAEPRSAYESFDILFRRKVADGELQMATGEAVAHLNWLARRGRVRALPGDVTLYEKV